MVPLLSDTTKNPLEMDGIGAAATAPVELAEPRFVGIAGDKWDFISLEGGKAAEERPPRPIHHRAWQASRKAFVNKC